MSTFGCIFGRGVLCYLETVRRRIALGANTMSFSDIGARFKKHAEEQEAAQPQPEPIDMEELYALRGRMLGVMIRDARVTSGYSVEDVAAQLELEAEAVVEWEFGRRTPSLPQLELLAYFLQVPISHFWGTETLMLQRSQRVIDSQEYQTLRNHMIGTLLQSRREELGLTRETVAERLEIDPDLIQTFELGQAAVPMLLLVPLASVLNVNLNYFMEGAGRIGEFFQVQELSKELARMPEDIRQFVTTPANEAYIRVAMALSRMPTDALRQFAEGLLEITL